MIYSQRADTKLL